MASISLALQFSLSVTQDYQSFQLFILRVTQCQHLSWSPQTFIVNTKEHTPV